MSVVRGKLDRPLTVLNRTKGQSNRAVARPTPEKFPFFPKEFSPMLPLVKRRVLCAEPHDDTCRLITSLLAHEGHEVKSAGSVRDCLELARGERFDLYMIDDDYVDGTSIELCRKLRALSPSTPILFFSSAAFE